MIRHKLPQSNDLVGIGTLNDFINGMSVVAAPLKNILFNAIIETGNLIFIGCCHQTRVVHEVFVEVTTYSQALIDLNDIETL
jgi:hypothetical protein